MTKDKLWRMVQTNMWKRTTKKYNDCDQLYHDRQRIIQGLQDTRATTSTMIVWELNIHTLLLHCYYHLYLPIYQTQAFTLIAKSSTIRKFYIPEAGGYSVITESVSEWLAGSRQTFSTVKDAVRNKGQGFEQILRQKEQAWGARKRTRFGCAHTDTRTHRHTHAQTYQRKHTPQGVDKRVGNRPINFDKSEAGCGGEVVFWSYFWTSTDQSLEAGPVVPFLFTKHSMLPWGSLVATYTSLSNLWVGGEQGKKWRLGAFRKQCSTCVCVCVCMCVWNKEEIPQIKVCYDAPTI
jgi:hypothetical protein